VTYGLGTALSHVRTNVRSLLRDNRGEMKVIALLRRARKHPVLGRVLRFRPVAVALALMLIMATATATAEAPMGSVIYGKLWDNQQVRLSMPPTDEPQGIAIFFHGQNGHVDNRMDDPWLQALVRSGWIVAASDFHRDSWGNEASVEDTRQLVEWAEQQTGLPVRLYVSGSMGGSVSLNAITHGVKAPACWYGVKPAVDLHKMDNVPGARHIIRDAFGGRVPTDRNPVDNIDALPTDTRYRFVASPQDTWVFKSENTDLLMQGLKARGAKVSLLKADGTHDDASHWNAEDLVAFADSCAAG